MKERIRTEWSLREEEEWWWKPQIRNHWSMIIRYGSVYQITGPNWTLPGPFPLLLLWIVASSSINEIYFFGKEYVFKILFLSLSPGCHAGYTSKTLESLNIVLKFRKSNTKEGTSRQHIAVSPDFMNSLFFCSQKYWPALCNLVFQLKFKDSL